MSTTTRPSTSQYSSSSSTSSTDSDASYRLSMDARPVASVEVLRCLRCHRHVETTSTDDLASTGMIRSPPIGEDDFDSPNGQDLTSTDYHLDGKNRA
ncbi:hypothetical protein F4678DRAFT_465381 [Xylaria arbuscula]|nr:hypothetical protein F4678DRAFT_465381 [Xylaria arbuscula]